MCRHMRTSAAILSMLLVSLTPSLSIAGGIGDMEDGVRVEHVAEAPEFVKWVVSVPANSTIEVTLREDSSHKDSSTSLLWIISQSGAWSLSLIRSAGYTTYSEASVRVAGDSDAHNVSVRLEELEGPSGESVHRMLLNPRQDTTYTFVGVVAGAGDWRTRLSLSGPPSTEILHQSDGPALYRETMDFDGGRGAQVKSASGLVRADSAFEAKTSVSVQGTMFGTFASSSWPHSSNLSYRGPEGEYHAGQTSYVLTNLRPGEYDFVVERHIDMCLDCPLPRLWLLVADVT